MTISPICRALAAGAFLLIAEPAWSAGDEPSPPSTAPGTAEVSKARTLVQERRFNEALAPRDRGDPVEGTLRAPERAAGEAAFGAQTRPAARCRRTRTHPAVHARGEDGRTQPVAGRARLCLLREGLRGERRRGIHPHRDRGPGPQARHPPSEVAPGLHVRIVAAGGVGAPGAAPVRQYALRDQRVDARAVRALCLLPPAEPGRGLAIEPGAGDLAGDTGRQRETVRAVVRTGGRGDPRAPEQGGSAPWRRDRVGAPG